MAVLHTVHGRGYELNLNAPGPRATCQNCPNSVTRNTRTSMSVNPLLIQFSTLSLTLRGFPIGCVWNCVDLLKTHASEGRESCIHMGCSDGRSQAGLREADRSVRSLPEKSVVPSQAVTLLGNTALLSQIQHLFLWLFQATATF